MLKAILFDLYDTLAYLSPEVVQEGRRELARLANVDQAAWAAAWRANVMERMLGTLGGMEDEIRSMLRGLGADPPAELVAELAELEHRSWGRAINLYPEALPTLGELRRRGYKLGLISNCSVQAGQVVHEIGLAELMDALVLSCEVGVAKPDPAIFLHACRELGVEPAEAMFVADGAFGELDAARALGMATVKIEQAHQSGNYGTSTHFDHEIERLTQVLDLVASSE
jgi:putative hydrolase of the HAD superfamily